MNYNTAESPFNTYNIILFQPNQISNLALWLDAGDSNTLFQDTMGTPVTSNDQFVAVWNDKSPNHYNASNSANQPTFYNNSLRFLGNQYLFTQLSSSMSNQTGFAVISYNSSSVLDIISLTETSGIAGGVQQIIDNNQQLIQLYGGGGRTYGATLSPRTVLLYSYSFSFSNTSIYLNGTQTASNSSSFSFAGTGNVNIGGYDNGGEAFIGNIFEIVLFSNVLTTEEQQKVESYLAYKYNLVSFLPSNHPYKNAPYYAYGPYNNIASPYNPYLLHDNVFQTTLDFPSTITQKAVTQSEFTPITLSNCFLWLDANDQISFDSNGYLNTWNDKSGNDDKIFINLSTSWSLSTQLNNRNTIFYNSGPPIQTTLPFSIGLNDYTFIAVWIPTNIYINIVLSIGVTDNGAAGLGYNTPNGGYNYFDWAGPEIDVSYPTDQFIIQIGIRNSLTNSMYLNGSIEGTPISSSQNITDRFAYIGGVTAGIFPIDGQLAEVIVYPYALSDIQRQQIEGYLAWKWGLVSFLPSGHKYKNYPPPPQ